MKRMPWTRLSVLILAGTAVLGTGCTKKRNEAGVPSSTNADKLAQTADKPAATTGTPPAAVPAAPDIGTGLKDIGAAGERVAAQALAPGVPPLVFAMTTLEPRSGSTAKGTVYFSRVDTTPVAPDQSIIVTAIVEGAKPGMHGIHVHELGDCSAIDAMSAGEHFNPTKAPHAGPAAEARHAGDLGNIEIDANGKGQLSLTLLGLTGEGDLTSALVGRSVVLHESADDMTTQPSGNSGARIACGVITKGDGSQAH